MVVDLPAPLGPTNPVIWPGWTVKVIPSSASAGPKRLRTPATSTVASTFCRPSAVLAQVTPLTWLYGKAGNKGRTDSVISSLGPAGHPVRAWIGPTRRTLRVQA